VRTRAKVASVLSSVAVLVLGWELGAQATQSITISHTASSSGGTSSSSGSGDATGSTTPSDSAGTSTGSADSSSAASSSAADGTYTGDSVQTRYGSVQVAVTVSGGAITEVTAVHLTDAEQRSVQISDSAAPILRSEILQAQSAHVTTVSRATVTSDAYLESAATALAQAGW
jgi:uncharacterized protein with FMN-binding domain